MFRKTAVKGLAVAALLAGAAQPAFADGSWSGNGSYCAGSLFITCFSVNLTWVGTTATLTILNEGSEGDLIKAAGLFNLPSAVDYTVSGQSGYGPPPPNDLSNLPNEQAYAVTNDQGSMPGDGESGTWIFSFTGFGGSSSDFDDFISGASVGAHFISGPNGCSTKPIVNADGSFNEGPLDESCSPPTVVPEPGTMLLLATGLVGLSGATVLRRRKRNS